MDKRVLLAWVISAAVAMTASWSYQTAAQDRALPSESMKTRQIPQKAQQNPTGGGVTMPSVNAATGRKLFASKGCVVCHMVNGIGGQDGASLDASTMPGMTNPFDFVANMWRGAEPMIELQRKELGGQIEFTGNELADIIAFLHDEVEQKKFSKTDIPPNITAAMERMGRGDENMKRMK